MSSNQIGFVKGWSIASNVLLTEEIIHEIDIKSIGGNVIFKLDILKAFNGSSSTKFLNILVSLMFLLTWLEKL